jgi:hypothetical protein
MNIYQVIMTRHTNTEAGSVLESIPAIKANSFTVEDMGADFAGPLAQFWTEEGDKGTMLTASVVGFLAIIKIGEEPDERSQPLGDSESTA